MKALKAPDYQARNAATSDLLMQHGEPVIGTYTWVATQLLLLVSEANRDAFVIERAPEFPEDESKYDQPGYINGPPGAEDE